jgi:hypothetical protein
VELAAIVGGERRATGSEVGEEGNEVEEVEGLGDGRVEPGERVVPPRRPAARRCLRRRRNLHFISSDFFLWPPFDVVDIVSLSCGPDKSVAQGSSSHSRAPLRSVAKYPVLPSLPCSPAS